jgi:hypothetical protein
VLGSRYVEGFRRKWLGGDRVPEERLVGTSDIQSLADLANAFQVVRSMYLIPITRSTVLRLAIPLSPLVQTMVPFDEIIDRAIATFLYCGRLARCITALNRGCARTES